MALQLFRILGVLNQVMDLRRVIDDIIELFLRALSEVDSSEILREFAGSVELLKILEIILVISILRLEQNPVQLVVSSVPKPIGPNGANTVDRVVKTILGRSDPLTRLKVSCEQILTLIPIRNFNPGPGQGRRRQIKHVDQVITHTLLWHPGLRTHHHKGHMKAALGRHLLVTHEMVGTVVGEINDDRISRHPGAFEAR